MKTNNLRITMYVICLMILIHSALADMTIQQLSESYDYSYSNGTINATSYNDSMLDRDVNGLNDTLSINITTNAGSGTFRFIIEMVDSSGILINSTVKTLTSEGTVSINFPSELLLRSKLNYSVVINDNEDNIIFRKTSIETNAYSNYESGINITRFTDETVNNDFILFNTTISSQRSKSLNITATLAFNSSVITKTMEVQIIDGLNNISLKFDNETIKSTHYIGNFTIDNIIVGNKMFYKNRNTSIYNYEDFAKTSYLKSITDRRIDTNSNNLSEFLEINFTIVGKTVETVNLTYDLYDEFDNYVTTINKTALLNVGNQIIQTLINGSEIYNTKINGPYLISFVKLAVGNETRDIIFNAYTTNQTFYTDYERPPLPDLNVIMEVRFDQTTNSSNITLNLTNIGDIPAFNVFLDIFDNTTYNDNRSSAFLSTEESIVYILNKTNSSNASLFTAIADFDNLVDESDESNNIAQNTNEIEVSLSILNLTTVFTNGTLKIFEFIILNDGDVTVTDIQWQLDTGDGNVINSTQNISYLAPNAREFVYIRYNYSSIENFDITANATGISESDIVTASYSSNTTNGIIIINFTSLNSQTSNVIFEIRPKNVAGEVISNVNWEIDDGDGQSINSITSTNLQNNESAFIYIQHSYPSAGTYPTQSIVQNSQYSATETLLLNVI